MSQAKDENSSSTPAKPVPTGDIKRIICSGCSLLCDDVYVELEKESEEPKLIRTVNSCFRGDRFIKRFLSEERYSAGLKKQMGIEMNIDTEEAISDLYDRISKANSIKFYGLGAIGIKQQQSFMELIKKLRKIGKKVTFADYGNVLKLATKYGIPLTSVGQAINNGDIFIYWCTNPTHSHPKLTGKLLFTRGFFRATGKEVKRLVYIEETKNDKDATVEKFADSHIKCDYSERDNLISSIEKLLNSESHEGIKIGNLEGIAIANLKNYLNSAEFGVILTTIPINPAEADEWFSKLSKMLKLLNSKTTGKFSVLPLNWVTNERGIHNTIITTFSNKEYGELIAEEGPADLAVVIGGDYLRDEYFMNQYKIPEKQQVLFDNFNSQISKRAKLIIPYAVAGIEVEDLAIRFDGMNIKLHDWLPVKSSVDSVEKIVQLIIEKLSA